MPPPPLLPPVGLRLAGAARIVQRAFNQALADAGGSLPVWLVLLNLKIGRPGNQRELAEAVGIREATLTHHLNALDADGLITRRRDTANRRIHVVELTGAGEAMFRRLRTAAIAFDKKLRDGIADAEVTAFEAMLERLVANVAPGTDAVGWAGSIDGQR